MMFIKVFKVMRNFASCFQMAKAPRGNGAEIDRQLALHPLPRECLHVGAFRLHLINCWHNIVPDKLGCIPMKGIRSPPTWSFSKVPYLNVGGHFYMIKGVFTQTPYFNG
jgi:hypothetical protein